MKFNLNQNINIEKKYEWHGTQLSFVNNGSTRERMYSTSELIVGSHLIIRSIQSTKFKYIYRTYVDALDFCLIKFCINRNNKTLHEGA